MESHSTSVASLNGQWVGTFHDFPGNLILEIDDMETHYAGRAYVYDTRPEVPSTFAYIKTSDKAGSFRLDGVPLHPIDPISKLPSSWEALRDRFPLANFPQSANIEVELGTSNLSIAWQTDIGTQGHGVIPRTKADQESELTPLPDVDSWNKFKNFVAEQEYRRFIFRGQSRPYRLRTGYHRTGRADLMRYQDEDINTLNRHLSSRIHHKFDLTKADEYGAFFNLAQHHGYPTPLLDWSYSPYVAAFFAYHRITNAEAAKAQAKDEKVRIFVFDQLAWRESFEQYPTLSPSTPHFSLKEFMAIENARAIPQQSVSTVTNVDDIESHIQTNEARTGKQFLRVVDLPESDRRVVMLELSTMGVTAGSLFPGLDGACEELRERFFRL